MIRVYRTIESATYTPSSERTDNRDHHSGDVTYVRYVECDHVGFGNPIYTFRVGDSRPCFDCGKEAQS